MLMTSSARRAYGFARVSALKAGLRRPGRVAGHVVPAAPEALPDLDRVFEELVGVYRTVWRGYPEIHPLLDSLLARYELSNALLMLRALLHERPAVHVDQFWRDLRELATFKHDAASEATTPVALAAVVERSRLGTIASLVREARVESLASTSLGAERQVWNAIDRAFRDLPANDESTHVLGALLVVEQDLDWLRRAPGAASIDPSAAAGATCVLKRDLSPAKLAGLAQWTPERGPISMALPARWTWARGAADWDALMTAVRQQRRRHCVRAFVGDPFSLDVPLAVLLLKEEELRAVSTAAESAGAQSAAALRACAAGLFGA